jgi:hypothetical protein
VREKARRGSKGEYELRRKVDAARIAALAGAPAGAAAGVVGREVAELTETAVQKFLAYCRRYLGPA